MLCPYQVLNLACPPRRKMDMLHIRFAFVVGYVVKQHQPRPAGVFEIKNVKAGRLLIDTISKTFEFETHIVTNNDPVSGFVRHHIHRLIRVGGDDGLNDRDGSRHHPQTRLAILGRKPKRVGIPTFELTRVAALRLGPCQPFPMPMADLAQAIFGDRHQTVRLTDQGSGFECAAHG